MLLSSLRSQLLKLKSQGLGGIKDPSMVVETLDRGWATRRAGGQDSMQVCEIVHSAEVGDSPHDIAGLYNTAIGVFLSLILILG
jgi:hypothetical protein